MLDVIAVFIVVTNIFYITLLYYNQVCSVIEYSIARARYFLCPQLFALSADSGLGDLS